MKKKGLGLLALGAVMLILSMLSGYFGRSSARPESRLEHITVSDAAALIQSNKNEANFVVLDVRTPQEFFGERLENAVNLDYYGLNFRESLSQLDKDKIYLVYCRTGRRSSLALMIMEELGFKEAYNVLGGIVQWKTEGLPLSP
ncbi:MAG: rhodanese-like domain-containing protein [Clostridium sp.]|nr:rhodanese-like domain-containing protein [Clostridium sp.]